MICVTIDNGRNNTVGESCSSAHQAASRFVEYHIDVLNFVLRKCLTGACVSGDINKSFQFVTITDSKFSNKVLV